MLGIFERQRLVKRGLASAKVRRRRTENEWLLAIEEGNLARAGVLLGFMAGLAGLLQAGPAQQPIQNWLVGLLIFLVALAQLWINHPRTWASNSRLLLVFGALLAHLAAVKWVLVTADRQLAREGLALAGGWSALELQRLWLLLVPHALAPLTLSVLLGRNLGIYAAIFASLWSSMIYRGLDARLLVISLICGFIAVFATLDVRRRTQLAWAGLFVGLATWLLAFLFGMVGPISWPALQATHWELIAWQSVLAVGSGVVTAMLVSGVLPILESAFRVTTNISWLELADLNHPLLKRMTTEAPGTHHHSLVVAQLAEAACEAIGANAPMARVCAYFHDIGKLVMPEYFTENVRHGRNPHDELAPTMSALVIIAHVKEGVDLALKYGLKQEIIDGIQQHHGTSLAYFFYKRALQQQEDTRQGGKIMNLREEDIPEVREESFRYGGPKPQTREAAILMLADSIESASRSLEKVTPQKIDQLVEDHIDKRLADGQLRECDLTLRDLDTLAESFTHSLQGMLHSRVAYPSERGSGSERRETPVPAARVAAVPRSAA